MIFIKNFLCLFILIIGRYKFLDNLGLGLAIVKHIIDAHNEKIYVESDLGVGSEFSFSLEKSN